ncbi:hypothetical protein BKA82DRAFT_129624, partial [Pisolithus tinctorius]
LNLFCAQVYTAMIFLSIFTRLPQQVGKIGEYEECAFITPGMGAFIPTAAAQTTTGNQGVLQQVTEDRVEVVVNDRDVIVDLRNVITVLRKVRDASFLL